MYLVSNLGIGMLLFSCWFLCSMFPLLVGDEHLDIQNVYFCVIFHELLPYMIYFSTNLIFAMNHSC
jgi:hypothetical protein